LDSIHDGREWVRKEVATKILRSREAASRG
jgi:hypothetical protein